MKTFLQKVGFLFIFLFLCGVFKITGKAANAQTGANPSLRAPKKVVAVSNFENKTNYEGQLDLGYGMAEMLTDALIQSGQFVVLERQALDAVLAEQNLAQSGLATDTGGATSGDIQRAQILIEGTVTEFEETTSEGNQGFYVGGFGMQSDNAEAHVAMILRLIDTTTSQVIISHRVEGTAARGGVSYGYEGETFGFNQAGFKATPLGKATQIAIDRAVVYISYQMGHLPWAGKIVKVTEDVAYLNAGSESGVISGSLFMVFRKGEELRDSDTGLSLGSDDAFVGRMQIMEVQPKFSKGKSLDQPLFEGDIVKLPTAP